MTIRWSRGAWASANKMQRRIFFFLNNCPPKPCAGQMKCTVTIGAVEVIALHENFHTFSQLNYDVMWKLDQPWPPARTHHRTQAIKFSCSLVQSLMINMQCLTDKFWAWHKDVNKGCNICNNTSTLSNHSLKLSDSYLNALKVPQALWVKQDGQTQVVTTPL